MKKQSYNDNDPVTVGILKDILGEIVMKPMKEFREEFDEHVEWTKNSFEQVKSNFVEVRTEIALVKKDVTYLRQEAGEAKEVRQTVSGFDANLARHDREIADLQADVLELRTVK